MSRDREADLIEVHTCGGSAECDGMLSTNRFVLLARHRSAVPQLNMAIVRR